MVKPEISVVIVAWKVRDLLRENLRALFTHPARHSFEVFVADNASEDGTVEMIRSEFPQVHLIENDWDAGFAGPNNHALRLAQGDVLLLLNPDMVVGSGVLDHAYELLMRERDIGVLGVRLNDEQGKPIGSVRRFPTFWSQVATILKLPHVFPKIVRQYQFHDFDYTRCQDVDQVRGSFFAFRRDVMEKVGMLDPAYHIWFEEVDYCRRVRQAEYRVHYCAEVSCHDPVGKSTGQMTHFARQRILTASMVHYFDKWHPWYEAALLRVLRPFGLLACLGLDVWKRIHTPNRLSS